MPFIPSDSTPSIIALKPQAIVGIMRFSLLLEDSNYFPKMKGQSREVRKESIFSRSRLLRRFEIFEEICLPSLTGQTDQDYNMILVTSQDLPDWALVRLEKSVRNLPNIYVRAYRPKASIKRVYKRSAFEMFDPEADVTATFCLDDDDAVGRDYIERLRTYLTPENKGKIVTFARGYQLALSDETLGCREDTSLKSSAGLAAIHQGRIEELNDIKTVYGYGGHRQADRFAQLITDTTEAMYVQTANGFNVSHRIGGKDIHAMTAADIAKILDEKYPYLDASILERLHASGAFSPDA